MKKQIFILLGLISLGSAVQAMNPSNNNNENNNNAKVALAPHAAHFSTVKDMLEDFGNKTKSGNDRKLSNTKFGITNGIAQQLINFVTQKQPNYKNRAEIAQQWDNLKVMGATFEIAKDYALASRKLGVTNPVIAFAAEQNFYDATKKQWKDNVGTGLYDPSTHNTLSSDQLNQRRYDLLKQYELLLPGKGFWQDLFNNKKEVAKALPSGNYSQMLGLAKENKSMKGFAAVEDGQSLSGLTIATAPCESSPAKPVSISGSEIAQCPNLRSLRINLPFKSLPDEVSMLSHLKYLDLNRNNLKNIPPVVFNCCHLEELDCSENQIDAIDPAIENLTNLKKLNISDNKLESLPDSLAKMSALKEINARGNPLLPLSPLSATLNQLASRDVLSIDKTSTTVSVENKVPAAPPVQRSLVPASVQTVASRTASQLAHSPVTNNNNNENNNSNKVGTKTLLKIARVRESLSMTNINNVQPNDLKLKYPIAQVVNKPMPQPELPTQPTESLFSQEWQKIFEPMEIEQTTHSMPMPDTQSVVTFNAQKTALGSKQPSTKRTFVPQQMSTKRNKVDNSNNNNRSTIVLPLAAATHVQRRSTQKTVHAKMLDLAKKLKGIDIKEFEGKTEFKIVVEAEQAKLNLLNALQGKQYQYQSRPNYQAAEFKILAPNLVHFINAVDHGGLKIIQAPPQLDEKF